MKELNTESKEDIPSFNFAWLKPRYWGLWLGFAAAWLLVQLPLSSLYALGSALGRISASFAPYRRRVCATNIRLCFPHYTPQQQKELVRACFRSVGISLVETLIAWVGSERKLNRISFTLHGLDNLQHYYKNNATPRLLCLGFHFTTLEIIGRLLSRQVQFAVFYRTHPNPVFNYLMIRGRARYAYKMLERNEIRALIRILKQGIPMWYAPDQDYGRKVSVFAPFFNIPTATITTPAKMARSFDLTVLPVTYYRDEHYHYHLHIHSALNNYPSEDEVENATRINHILEKAIIAHPEQYLWQHRRFKTRTNKIAKIYVKKKK